MYIYRLPGLRRCRRDRRERSTRDKEMRGSRSGSEAIEHDHCDGDGPSVWVGPDRKERGEVTPTGGSFFFFLILNFFLERCLNSEHDIH
jgi:hypothetical protein